MIRSAHAHGIEEAHHAVDLASAWTLDPLVLVPLALSAWLYAKGARRFGAREAAFAGGMLALVLALVWPLDVLGEQLFSMHMAQHAVMMNLAAPLLVLGAPLGAMLRALPIPARRALAGLAAGRRWRGTWHFVTGAAAAAVLQQVALWGWHTPRGIAASLDNDAIHIAMHASLLLAALLFWTAVLRPRSGEIWPSLAALLLTLKITGIVCIVMMLQTEVVYPAYGAMAQTIGRSPVDDEQIGWGLMMVAGTLTYLGAGVALMASWFGAHERAYPPSAADPAAFSQPAAER